MRRPSCNSDRGDGTRTPRRNVTLHRTSLCRWRKALTFRKCPFLPTSVVCLRKWKRTTLLKGLRSANTASATGTRCVTAALNPGAWRAGTFTRQASVSLQSSSLGAAVAEETTMLTIVVAVRGKRRRCLCKASAVELVQQDCFFYALAFAAIGHLPNRKHWAIARTALPNEASLSKLTMSRTNHPTSGLSRRSERQAAHSGGPCNSAGTEVLVIKS